jgi:O-antigen/teichoic acid export membrane protein
LEPSANISTRQSLKWNTINYGVNLGSKFLITVVLQRLLNPSDFGLIASILVFTGVAQVIVDNGFQSAIVQSYKLSEEALSTVFFINVGIGALCSIALFALAPFIGDFISGREIVPVIHVLSMVYIVQSVSLVQRALLMRGHAFKALAVIEIGASVLAGVTAIFYALQGGGVWSLVIMMLGQAALTSFFFWIQPGAFKPSWVFEPSAVKDLWKFGSNVFMNGLFIYLNSRIDLLLTGRFMGLGMQGYYSRGKDYGLLPSGVMVGIVSKSYFPIFSRLHSNEPELRQSYLRALETMALVAAVAFPPMYLLVGYVIQWVLGDKWNGMIEVTQWFIVLSSLYIFNSINANFLAGIGKPRNNLIIQASTGIVRITTIFFYFRFANELSMTVTVFILILFSFIENHLSFYSVDREKAIGVKNIFRHSYLILMPAWLLAFAIEFLLRPLLECVFPQLVVVLIITTVFLGLLYCFFRFMRINIPTLGLGIRLFRKKG